jgi:hypothetical protein
MMSFFYKKASGLNRDIKRHRETEQELLLQIENATDDQTKRVYKYFLSRLLASKAGLVNKIGRKS